MALAYVQVTSCLTGEELLPETLLPCAELLRQVRAALDVRPSRTVTLFHEGAVVGEDFSLEADDPQRWPSVSLTAVVGDALSAEDRAEFLQKLDHAALGDSLQRVGVPYCSESLHGPSQYRSYVDFQRRFVPVVFRDFPEAARDDSDVVLAAVRKNGRCLEHASTMCKNDKAIVQVAVQQNGAHLQFAGETCKNDKEIVLAAVKQKSRALYFASESCRNDEELVLVAVRQDGFSLQFASEACKDDRNIVSVAMAQNPLSLSFAGAALQNDPELQRMARPTN